MKETKKYTFIDLFAGCGGLSEGFLQNGKFVGLAHVEWELPMVETLRKRLVEKWNHTTDDATRRVVRFDVQKTDELIHGNWTEDTIAKYGADNDEFIISNGLKGLVDNDGVNRVDLIIGGPPCQAYSIAGRVRDPNGMKDDYRNYLFESFVKIVNYFKPRAFVFENVPGLLSACPGDIPVKERIYDAFRSIGYSIREPEKLKTAVYRADDFGVPQSRKRIIIFGVNDEDGDFKLDDLYDSLSSREEETKVSVRDAIGNLPRLVPLNGGLTSSDEASPQKSDEHRFLGSVIRRQNNRISHIQEDMSIPRIDCHYSRYHKPRDLQIFKEWLGNDMNGATKVEQQALYTRYVGKTSNHVKYRNLEWDKPSPTIVAHLSNDGYLFIHPDEEQLRTLTMREAACLQSFPMDYHFVGTMSYIYKMIGNAVPVKLANTIANSLSDVLDKSLSDEVEHNNEKSMESHRKILNVLVACEESQAVCSEFRKLGHNAYSCDLQNCSGGHPEWHFNFDVLKVIKEGGGVLENGNTYFLPQGQEWDIMIAHPPCTFLAVSGAQWYYNPEDKDLPINQRRPHPKYPDREKDREDGAAFFMAMANAPIRNIAIENPVGIMSSRWRKADQIIQPYMFGDEATKTTCLWLKNLPNLTPTDIVGKGERMVFKSGKSMPMWYAEALAQATTKAERQKLRSKTFHGIARAMAEQWSDFLTDQDAYYAKWAETKPLF